MRLLVIFITFALNALPIFSQGFENEMQSLSQIGKNKKSIRVSSFDKTGGNNDALGNIKDGEKVTIMDVKGTGIINHIWITMAPDASKLNRNDILIRMFWDGNSFPSVESPIGPFFGNGWNESYNFYTIPLSVAPTWAKSYVCYFAMPFSQGARIEIENQSGTDIQSFYFNIDYTQMPELPEGSGRFHAWYNHQLAKAVQEGEDKPGVNDGKDTNRNGNGNYLFADIKGKGKLAGINYYINSPTTSWYGEGDEMIFLDGDTLASLNGTGTEDFFNTSFGPKEHFQHPYFGYARVNNETGWLGRTHVYRFFIVDPVYFGKSCKFTIEHGHNNNLTLDLASVAYWYQDKASALPGTFTREERRPKPLIRPEDIQRWNNAWRTEQGNDPGIWGNEHK